MKFDRPHIVTESFIRRDMIAARSAAVVNPAEMASADANKPSDAYQSAPCRREVDKAIVDHNI